jgi:hypothetical protein
VNCLIYDNVSNIGSGISLSYSHPKITNCTIVGNTCTDVGGGIACAEDSSPRITNCVLWWNTPEQIFVADGQPVVTYSSIELGYSGQGNIDTDPAFADPTNGDYRMLPGSPCIDAADNTAVPPTVTVDFDGNPRLVDDPCTEPDTGNGAPPIVDMGAYEYQPCGGDVDCDGDTDHADLGALLGAWDSQPGDPNWNPAADLDADGHVGHGDLGILLADWGCGT